MAYKNRISLVIMALIGHKIVQSKQVHCTKDLPNDWFDVKANSDKGVIIET